MKRKKTGSWGPPFFTILLLLLLFTTAATNYYVKTLLLRLGMEKRAAKAEKRGRWVFRFF